MHPPAMHTTEPGPTLTDRIIGLAIKLHRKLGPGLLETVYHHCLCEELQHDNLEFQREVPLAVIYEDVRLNQGYLADIIVAQTYSSNSNRSSASCRCTRRRRAPTSA